MRRYQMRMNKLAYEIILRNPASPDYRQGKTLGDYNKHWFSGKFFRQYQLFLKYHLESKVIVYAWVNDEANKRPYESKTDAYKVFSKMLKSENPPDNWNALLNKVKDVEPINIRNSFQ